MAKAYFSAGCFWGVEYYFKRLKGVTKTAVGFMGGELKNPSYKQVKTGLTGHLETIEVVYDPNVVSYEALVRYFFEIHDFLSRRGLSSRLFGPAGRNARVSCLAEGVLNDFEHMPPINAKTVFRFTICIFCKKFWLIIEILYFCSAIQTQDYGNKGFTQTGNL